MTTGFFRVMVTERVIEELLFRAKVIEIVAIGPCDRDGTCAQGGGCTICTLSRGKGNNPAISTFGSSGMAVNSLACTTPMHQVLKPLWEIVRQ